MKTNTNHFQILLISFTALFCQEAIAFTIDFSARRHIILHPITRNELTSVTKIGCRGVITCGMSNNDDYASPPPPGRRPKPAGGDMAYMKDNIQRQMETYSLIKEAGGWDSVNDVYVRDPQQSQFWYVGKVARCTGTVSLKESIARQLNLIEEHATRLRPIELGRSLGKLEVWCAPGGSETLMANNDPKFKLDRMSRYVEGCENIDSKEVGFNAEVVTNQGVGFSIERTDDGVVPPHLL